MADVGFFEGIARDLSGRGIFGGSFQLRLIAQPLFAVILGIRCGVRDARKGLEPFFMRLVHAQNGRSAVIKEALRDAIIPLCLALVLDGVLQYLILKHVRLGAAVVVGTLLVFLPFTLARAWSNRVWRHRRRHETAHA